MKLTLVAKREGKNKSFIVKLNILLLLTFAINVVFIPYDNFNLKMIALVLLLGINCKSYLKLIGQDEVITFTYGFVMMLSLVLQSFILTGNFSDNLKIGYTFVILLLYIPIKKYQIDFVSIIITIIRAMGYFIVLMFLLDLLWILPIYSNPILMWLHSTGNANIGKYSSLIIGIAIFMKTSPMLLFAMADAFKKDRKLEQIIMLVAMILTGTRANIFVGIGFFLFCYINKEKSVARKVLVVGALLLLGGIIGYRVQIIDFLINIFENKANSDAVRTGTLESIFEYWKENLYAFFFGSGYIGKFYNEARDRYLYDVELSYWNLLRQVGVFQFVFLMYMYIKPLIKLLIQNNDVIFAMAYIGYLVIAYTNPFLITSTGLTVVLTVYCLAYLSQYKKDI